MDALDSCAFKVTGAIKITKHRTNGRNWIQPAFTQLWNTFLKGVRQIQRLIKYLKEANVTLPKRSFHFMNSTTLSHRLSQKKALLIKVIEKAVPTIPEVCWVVVLIDELLCWSEMMSDVKEQRCPSENAQLSWFFSWGVCVCGV